MTAAHEHARTLKEMAVVTTDKAKQLNSPDTSSTPTHTKLTSLGRQLIKIDASHYPYPSPVGQNIRQHPTPQSILWPDDRMGNCWFDVRHFVLRSLIGKVLNAAFSHPPVCERSRVDSPLVPVEPQLLANAWLSEFGARSRPPVVTAAKKEPQTLVSCT